MRPRHLQLAVTMSVGIAVLAVAASQSVAADGQAVLSHTQRRVQAGVVAQPGFETNRGQFDSARHFRLQGRSFDMFLKEAGFEIWPRAVVTEPASGPLSIGFRGSQARRPVGQDLLPGRLSYFLSPDPSRWVADVPTYDAVRYPELYSSIDLVVHRRSGRPEYDFIVSPWGRPDAIVVEIAGADRLSLEPDGSLTADLGRWAVVQAPPIAWQDFPDGRRTVAVRYELQGDDLVGFNLGPYDPNRSLVIDPVLQFSTYFGGGSGSGPGGIGSDAIRAVAVDTSGDIYVTGRAQSGDVPITALDVSGGGSDVFVAKFSSDGSTLLYAARIGSNGNDSGIDIAVDGAGNAYVAAATDTGTDFPVVSAFQPAHGGGLQDGLVFKLNGTGTALVYSSYVGGPSFGTAQAIDVDPTGLACISGAEGAGFPTTSGAFQTAQSGDPARPDGYVACLNADGSLRYATYIGGAADDEVHDIAVDGSGTAFVTGFSNSVDFPTAGAPFQSTMINHKAFVARFEPDGSDVVYSTLLGGSAGERGWGILLHPDETVSVTGVTNSTDFPLVGTPYQSVRGSGVSDLDVFVATLDMHGSSLLASTYLGGSDRDHGYALDRDALGNIYVAGDTKSGDFPSVDSIQALAGGIDGFVTKLSPDLSASGFSTLIGGTADDGGITVRLHNVAVDGQGAVVTGGATLSTDLPMVEAWQDSLKGNVDGFIAKFVDVLNVSVDIKPGSFPNSINLGSNGAVPVAILGSEAFDVSSIDPTTVTLASAPVRLKGKGTPMASLNDVNDDGILDLVVHVETEALQLSYGDHMATLEGQTFTGLTILGVDSVRVVQ